MARSSIESEYRSMALTVYELTWLYNILQELHIPISTPITLLCYNTSVIQIAGNHVLHERTKHIEIDIHFVRDKVFNGFIALTYLSTQQQSADLFTK